MGLLCVLLVCNSGKKYCICELLDPELSGRLQTIKGQELSPGEPQK